MSKPKITHPGILDYYKDNLKPLSLYYKIKHTHKNSVVYNWNYHKISRNLNVSYYLAKKYTNILIQEGIAFERDNHLVFMSMNKLYKHIHRTPASNGWQYVNVTHNSGISEVEEELKFLLLQYRLSHQKYSYQVRHDNKMLKEGELKLSPKNAKRLVKDSKKVDMSSGNACKDMYIGMRKMGSLLGCSRTKASELVRKWKEDKRIFTEHAKRKIATGVMYMSSDKLRGILGGSSGHYYVFNNILYLHQGTQISPNKLYSNTPSYCVNKCYPHTPSTMRRGVLPHGEGRSKKDCQQI